eukprot:Hpha_TRINITY_DN11254_c0_g1::TRINITY_DN11254_c0_g1_i1::g.167588::m.167588
MKKVRDTTLRPVSTVWDGTYLFDPRDDAGGYEIIQHPVSFVLFATKVDFRRNCRSSVTVELRSTPLPPRVGEAGVEVEERCAVGGAVSLTSCGDVDGNVADTADSSSPNGSRLCNGNESPLYPPCWEGVLQGEKGSRGTGGEGERGGGECSSSCSGSGGV